MKTWSKLRLSLVGDKLQVFFLGLLLGLVLGGGFFLLKLDEYVQKMEIYKSLTQRGDDEKTATADTDKTKKTSPKTTKTNSRSINNTEETPLESDSTSVDPALENTSGGGPASDEIVVRTNELIGENVVQLRSLDGSGQNDSVARKEAGIKEESARNITVEYWKSPLNSKGYKLTRSRLVLFGYAPEDKIQLNKLDNIIYMKTAVGVFKLELSSSFRQLERVTDDTVLSRLNG